MKVSEAEKLVCPFIQSSLGTVGYSGVNPVNIKCITTKCMAWDDGKSTNNNPDIGKCRRLS